MPVINLHVSLTPFRNESRVLKESESLAAAGLVDKVCIVALHEDGLRETEQIDAARDVVRVRLSTRSLPKNLFSQLIKYAEFGWQVLKIAKARGSTIHNMHSVGLIPIGVLLKLFRGGKLIFDAHELETETNGLVGMRKRAAKLVERATIGFADLVIVVSPGIERWYRERYRGLPIVTVLNTPRHVSSSRSSVLREKLGIPDHFRIAIYQGGLMSNRGIKELIDAAPIVAKAGYAIVFMGYGPMQAEVEAAAARNVNIYFYPAVPPSQILRHTASADVGICSISGVSLSYRLSLPNKLFEYIAAGIPVIASALPEMERVIMMRRVGVCVSTWTPDVIAAALSEIDHMRGAELDSRISRTAEEYSWESQEAAMIAAYRNLLGRASAGAQALL